MTCTIELLKVNAEPVRPCEIAEGDDWERGPCPMTGRNECPSDAATQAKCPQC